ncbi:uncharacterized protein [Thunnus thynnus]|uniref:uncharacterized protein n=1 Tax=Thunnus thynnus TaxID=8237 RepID=UPI003527C7B3
MATEGGEDVQQAEKVGLKRKLTGPPRLLLLGKTRTRSVKGGRPETRNKANRTDTDGDGSSPKHDEPAEAPVTEEEVSCGDTAESHRGRCEVTGEGADITNRKVNRRRWWRRFSPAVVCFTRQTKGEKRDQAPQENDAALLNDTNTEENTKHVKEKKTTFRRFLTSQKRDEKPSLSFKKKLRMFLSRRRRSRSSLGNMEDVKASEEAPRSSVARGDDPADLHGVVTDRSPEVVTITAEMNVQLSEETTSPDESPTEERRVGDVEEATDAADESETEVAAKTNEVPVDDLNELDEVFCDAAGVPSDVDDHHLSSEEETSEQPTTNGPAAVLLNSSVRIELVPPDDITEEEEEEEEEECREGNQNHHHLLLLLGFHRSERQLLQTARSVVRAAMNAAVDQLSREQLSGVHREPQGCRDHA